MRPSPLEFADQSPLLDVLLDFEVDAETSVADKRTEDGQQSVRLHNSVRMIQDRERAVSGSGAAEFYGEGKTHDSWRFREPGTWAPVLPCRPG